MSRNVYLFFLNKVILASFQNKCINIYKSYMAKQKLNIESNTLPFIYTEYDYSKILAPKINSHSTINIIITSKINLNYRHYFV